MQNYWDRLKRQAIHVPGNYMTELLATHNRPSVLGMDLARGFYKKPAKHDLMKIATIDSNNIWQGLIDIGETHLKNYDNIDLSNLPRKDELDQMYPPPPPPADDAKKDEKQAEEAQAIIPAVRPDADAVYEELRGNDANDEMIKEYNHYKKTGNFKTAQGANYWSYVIAKGGGRPAYRHIT